MGAVILRFAVLGTFVGGGVFVLVRDIASSASLPSLATILLAPAAALFWAVLTWFLALPFGFLPACAAGSCYWYILARHTHSNPGPILRAALGAGLGLLVSTIFGLLFAFGAAPGAYGPEVNLLSWACAGVTGGALSALVIRNATYAVALRDRVTSGEA